jgi:hypothetical protein
MPRKVSEKKKWQQPKLRIHRKSEEEMRLLEQASTTIPLCYRAVNKDGRCYRTPACSPSKNQRGPPRQPAPALSSVRPLDPLNP